MGKRLVILSSATEHELLPSSFDNAEEKLSDRSPAAAHAIAKINVPQPSPSLQISHYTMRAGKVRRKRPYTLNFKF
jgi:hypothetical protein